MASEPSVHRWSWADQLAQDLRYALRQLAHAPGFTLVAVLTLGLGIAGVTTQFSVVNAALLRDLPFRDPERLVTIGLRNAAWPPSRVQTPPWTWAAHAPPQHTLTAVAGYYSRGSFIATTNGGPQRWPGSHVTPGLFALLGVRPALGRDFTEADNVLEAPRVTIISDHLWATEFSRDPAIVGRRIRLNGKPAEIVGVMPPGFQFPQDELWLPVFNEYPPRGAPQGFVGRLADDASPRQAAAEWTTLVRNADERGWERGAFTDARVEPLRDVFVRPQTRALLLTLLAAVAVVLAIACVNVMNLQFARAVARTRELGVRAALGAGTGRLLRLLLVEDLVLVVLGGLMALALTHGVARLLPGIVARQAAGTLPVWMTYGVDGRVLAVSAAVMALALLAAGLAPALLGARSDPVSALKDGGRGLAGGRVTRISGALIVGQIALTCVLLCGSLLLGKSIARQLALDFGYDTAAVVSARMNLEAGYADDDARRTLFRRLLGDLRGDARFHAAAVTTRRSMLANSATHFRLEGEAPRPQPDGRVAFLEVVSDGYFAALGLRPLRGREFEPGAGANASVLVNITFARKYFGTDDVLGRRLGGLAGVPGRPGDAGSEWRTIVGIVPDTLMQGPQEPRADGAGVFLPLEQFSAGYATVLVRGRGSPQAVTDALRGIATRIDPDLALYGAGTTAALLSNALAPTWLVVWVFSAFGLVALALAAVGLYGVTSFAVTQGTREFGIRMALGATRGAVLRQVLGRGFTRLALGLVAGTALALALAQWGRATVDPQLFQVSRNDPFAYAVAGLVLTAVTLAASAVPARRATRVDPMTALRRD